MLCSLHFQSKDVDPWKVSNGKLRADTVKIADIDNRNCTKNQENGTIITQIINLGSACFNSYLSCHFHIIFINAIHIRRKAKIK